MTTYPLPTLAASVSAAGISAPPYSDILLSLQASFQAIYGSDAYIQPDSQDGQLLALVASAINDCNQTAIAVYNAYSPATAQGTGLSSVVKINGLARAIPTNSTVDLLLTGQAGTTITNGAVTDANQNHWLLPASVTIPVGGQIIVTATAVTAGAISAPAGTVTTIATPTRGWQAVTNPADAAPGAPVETDAALRQRQAVSTALPSRTVLEGIVGAVASLTGVTRYQPYENDTDATDANGLPSHSIALVVEGGDALAIAQAIATKKGPGVRTYGTTTETVPDAYGIPHQIGFYRPTEVPIAMAIRIKALPGYSTAVGAKITAAVVAAINALSIGQSVLVTRLYVPANLAGGFATAAGATATDALTFELLSVAVSRSGTPTAADVTLAFNEAATCTAASVTLTVI